MIAGCTNGPTGILQVLRPRLGHYPSHLSGASYRCTKNGGDNRPYTGHPLLKVCLKIFGEGELCDTIDDSTKQPHAGLGHQIDNPIISAARANNSDFAQVVKTLTKMKVADVKKLKIKLQANQKRLLTAFAPMAKKYYPEEYKLVQDILLATERSLET